MSHIHEPVAVIVIVLLKEHFFMIQQYFSGQSLFNFPSIPCRLPDLVEYIVEPLLAGLGDNSSYVRRCAVMGCVKLYHLIPDFIEGTKSASLFPLHS